MVVSRSDAKRRKRPEGVSLQDSPKRTKVHAQRKFAQGSHMNCPVLTPVKDKDKVKFNGALANAELVPAKRPKTEEFVNFLCFRGSDMLPKSLEFFNKPAAPENSRKDHSCAGPSRGNTRNNDKQLDQITVVAKAEAKPRNKQKSIAAVQALKKKYQEQRKAKEKITLTKLALKVKGKNMMRTRSAGPLDEVPTSTVLKKPLRNTKLMASVKSKVIATKPAIRKHPPPRKRSSGKTVTRGGLRSGGVLPSGSDLGLKNERKPRKMFKFKSSLRAKNVRRPEIASSLSDFSSDDDQPLVKKQRVVASSSIQASRVVTRSRITVKATHSQLKRTIRPTRKTKEAATAYMEMLGKELGNPDEDIEDTTTKETDQRSQKVAGKRNTLKNPLAKNKIIKTQVHKSSKRETLLSSFVTEKSKEEINDNISHTAVPSIKTRHITKILSKTGSIGSQERNIKKTPKVRPVSFTMSKTIPKDSHQANLVEDVMLSKDINIKPQSNRKSKETKQNTSSVKSSISKNSVENVFNDSDEEPLNNKVNPSPHLIISSGSTLRNSRIVDSKESISEGKLIKDKAAKDISKELVKSTNRPSNHDCTDTPNKVEKDTKMEIIQQSKASIANSKSNSEFRTLKIHSNNKNKMQTRFEHKNRPESPAKGKRKIVTSHVKETNNSSKQNLQEKFKLSIERNGKTQLSLKSIVKNKIDKGKIPKENSIEDDNNPTITESVSTRNSCKMGKNNLIKVSNCNDESSNTQCKELSKNAEEPKDDSCSLEITYKSHELSGSYRNKCDENSLQNISLIETFNNKTTNETKTTLDIFTIKESQHGKETDKLKSKSDVCYNESYEIKQNTGIKALLFEENKSNDNVEDTLIISKPFCEKEQLEWSSEAMKIKSNEEKLKSKFNDNNELPSNRLNNYSTKSSLGNKLENTVLNKKDNISHKNIDVTNEVMLIDEPQIPEQKHCEIVHKNEDNLINKHKSDSIVSQPNHLQCLGKSNKLIFGTQPSNDKIQTLCDAKLDIINKEIESKDKLKANNGSALKLSQPDRTAKCILTSTFQNVPGSFIAPNSSAVNYCSEGIDLGKIQASTLTTVEKTAFESSTLSDPNQGTKFDDVISTNSEGCAMPKGNNALQDDKVNCIQINVNNVQLNKNIATVQLSPVDKGSTDKLSSYNYHENKEESIVTPKDKFSQALYVDSEKQSISINKDILGSLHFQKKDIHSSNKNIKEFKNEHKQLVIESDAIHSCFISKSDHHEMSEKLSAVDSLMRLKNTKKFIEKEESSSLDVKFASCKKSPDIESKKQSSDIESKDSKRVKFQEPDIKLFHEGDYKRFPLHESDIKHVQVFEHELKRNQLLDTDFKRFQQQDYKPKPEHSQVLKGCSNPKSMLKPGTLIDIAGISHSPEIMAPLRPGLDGETIPMGKPIKLEADTHFTMNAASKVYDPKNDQHLSGYMRQTEKKRSMFDQTLDKDISDNKARVPVNESAWRQAFKNVKDPKSNVNIPAEKHITRKPTLSVTALAKKHNEQKPGVNDKNISYQPPIPFLRQNKVFFSSAQSKNQILNKTIPDKKSSSTEIDSKTLRQKEAEVEEFVRQYVTGELNMAFPTATTLQSSSSVIKDKEKTETKPITSNTSNINNEESFLEIKEISKIFHSKSANENNKNKVTAIINKQCSDELETLANQTSITTSLYSESIKRTNSPPINPNKKSMEFQSGTVQKQSENLISTFFNMNSPQYQEQALNASAYKPEDSKIKTTEVYSAKNETSASVSSNNLPFQQDSKNLVTSSQSVSACTKNKSGYANECSSGIFTESHQTIANSSPHKGSDHLKKGCLQPDLTLLKLSHISNKNNTSVVKERNQSPTFNTNINENDSLWDPLSRCHANVSSLSTGQTPVCSANSPSPSKCDNFLKSNVYGNELCNIMDNKYLTYKDNEINVSFSIKDNGKSFKESIDSGMCKDLPNETVLSVNTSSLLRNSMLTDASSDNQDSAFERDKPSSFIDSVSQAVNSRASNLNKNQNKISENLECGETKVCLPVPVAKQLINCTAISPSKKINPNQRDEVNESTNSQCFKQSENVCDDLDDHRKVQSDIKITPKVTGKFVSGIYSHSEPQELDLMLKRKVNMSTEEIKRWINESSQSILEHIPNCGYLENNVCECEYRNSAFPSQHSDSFHDQRLIKTENCSSLVDHSNLVIHSKSEKVLSITTDILTVQHADQPSDYSDGSNLKQCNEQQIIRVRNCSETIPTNLSPETSNSKSLQCKEKDQCNKPEQTERNINIKSVKPSPVIKSQNYDELQQRTSIPESNKMNSCELGYGNKNRVADGNNSNLLDYSGTYPQSPKDDNSFLNDVSSSNDETPEKCNHMERKSIFNQRRSILKVKERKEPVRNQPSTNAFSPENESSVYAFDPDLPPTSTPFRRSKGKDNKTNNSSTDENESFPSSNSIAVQVNFDNETVLECSTQTDAQEGDDDDPNTFYIPLQQKNMDVSKPPLIQGVAVKLDTEGPNQKVIMRAKLVTKPLSTFNQSSSGRAVIGSKSGKPEQKVRPLSVKLPVGTVQPTARAKPKSFVPEDLPGPSKVASPQATRLAKRTKVKSAAPTTSMSEHQAPKVAPAKLVEAPTFYPTEKEFEDPLEYIESITPSAEKYGLCRVVPPANFKPECRVSDDMRFTAYNQYIHKMLHRWGPNVKEMLAIKRYLATQSISLKNPPLIGGMEVDLPRLYQTVQSCGGLKEVIEKKRWHRVADAMKIPKSAQDRVTKLDDIYCKFLLPYDTLSHEERTQLMDNVEKYWIEREKRVACSEEDSEDDDNSDSDIDECILKGRSMALNAFYRIARNTMSMWFNKTEHPPASDVELEFWRHVASRQHHVCVHAGSIDSGSMGYGFPTGKNSSTSRHPWNLKMLTNNPGSILRFLGPIMGVTVPTLHVGMLFSACCWYRDPHGLPWIEYLHTGASKIWYGIPDSSSSQLRDAVESIVPRLCRNKTLWLASDTAMVPPPLLVERGVSLSRIVQDPGQFIIVFPKSYTSSVCTGYLVSESVYFAQPSWLVTAHKLFNEMKESSEPTVFSLDKLLFSIVNDSRSSVSLLTQIFPIVVSLRDGEIAGRRQLEELGVNASERLNTNKRRKSRQTSEEDEDYECDECRTNLFISFMSNSHDGAAYCLPHAVKLLTHKRSQVKYCSLVYSFSEDELEDLVEKLKSRVENKSQKKVQSKSSKS